MATSKEKTELKNLETKTTGIATFASFISSMPISIIY